MWYPSFAPTTLWGGGGVTGEEMGGEGGRKTELDIELDICCAGREGSESWGGGGGTWRERNEGRDGRKRKRTWRTVRGYE